MEDRKTQSIGLGNSHYRPQHEFIFYSGGQWFGDKSQSDVWELSRGATGEYVHPTQKPVELIEKAVNNSSKQVDIIIACEKINRKGRLMELDEKYCDVIINRWQNFTGKKSRSRGNWQGIWSIIYEGRSFFKRGNTRL